MSRDLNQLELAINTAPYPRFVTLREQLANRAVALLEEDGGFTLSVSLGGSLKGTHLWAVGVDKQSEKVFEGPITATEILDYITDHQAPLSGDCRLALGGWRDGSRTVLDVVVLIENREHALAYARAHDQEAIYHLATGETLYTHNPEL